MGIYYCNSFFPVTVLLKATNTQRSLRGSSCSSTCFTRFLESLMAD